MVSSKDHIDWLDAFYLLEDYLTHQSKIVSILSHFYKSGLTEKEIVFAHEVLDLLRPFRQLADDMSAEEWNRISKTIPFYMILSEALNRSNPGTPFAKQFKFRLETHLRMEFTNFDLNPAIATVLDPHFKAFDLSMKTYTINTLNELRSILANNGKGAKGAEGETLRDNF